MDYHAQESCMRIAQTAVHVKIDQAGVRRVSDEIAAEIGNTFADQVAFCRKSWQHELRPSTLDEHALSWIFLCGNWNYCFWPEEGEEPLVITHKGESYKRSWAMVAAVTRALDGRTKELADPKWQINATEVQVKDIFQGDEGSGEVPLLHERVRSLQDLGKWTEAFGGLTQILKLCNKSAITLISYVVKMTNWNDSIVYQRAGKEEPEQLWILKRAQLLCADLWYCAMQSENTEISELCKFTDMNQLSAFADYRIPQTLESFGAIKYSDHLISLLHNKHRFQPGDNEEVEIRGVSVHAATLIANELRDNHPEFAKITDVVVDTFLWTYAMLDKNQCQKLPHHLCRTVFY